MQLSIIGAAGAVGQCLATQLLRAESNRPVFETFGAALTRYRTGREVVVVVTNPVELGVKIFSRYLDRMTAVNPCQNRRFSGLERLELASLSQKTNSRKVETTASLKRHHSKAVGSFEDLDSGTTMQWEAFQRLPSVWG
jgi:malate/lactate dehydrogenase